MKLLSITDSAIQVMGRTENIATAQLWVFPYTQATFRFTGTRIGIRLRNRRTYGDSHIGIIIDGCERKLRINQDNETLDLILPENLPDIEHEVTFFKRQDGQHYIEVEGFLLDDNATAHPTSNPLPERKILMFGDSITCGERNEATLYENQSDPDADLSAYSNAWWSYGAIAARELNAQLHTISQGGISLTDGIGWFHEPDYIGMTSVWDRMQYNPELGPLTKWNTKRYQPHVIVVALGQNDAHPHDFMASDYKGEHAQQWRRNYAAFLETLRETYPAAHIVCVTSIMQHDSAWDRAIKDAIDSLKTARISHLIYTRNASGTPGHPRIVEHKEMARELIAHIENLGGSIWHAR